MNVRQFVSGSSLLLAGWLGVTFVREVPPKQYPTIGRSPAPEATASTPREDNGLIALELAEEAATR